jgi:hypothetical protein
MTEPSEKFARRPDTFAYAAPAPAMKITVREIGSNQIHYSIFSKSPGC